MRLLSTARTVLLLTMGITLAMTTATANAAPTRPMSEGCAWGLLCVYSEAGFNGGLSIPTVPSGSCDHYRYADWRSARNFTNQYVRLWDGSDCVGANRLLPPGYSVADLGFGASGVGGL
jgi:hypothetical protein